MKWLMMTLACALCLAAAPDRTAAPPARHDVTIDSLKFSPASVEIHAGDTVTWTNNDDRDHTVIAKDGSFKSDNLRTGQTFDHKFTKPGKYPYGCSYHPRMGGVVVVIQ